MDMLDEGKVGTMQSNDLTLGMVSQALRQTQAGKGRTAVPRLRLFSSAQCNQVTPSLNEPLVTLVLQGAKQISIGDRVLTYGEGESFIIGAEIPVTSRIVRADTARPYVSLSFDIDAAVISSVLLDMAECSTPELGSAFAISVTDHPTINAWARLLDLLDHPDEIGFLAPLLERELMFRVLRGPLGEILRHMAVTTSRLSRLRRSMAWMQDHYLQQIRIGDMAAVAGMSGSVFHKRFKEAMALSPGQYHKQLRLHEARRRLLSTSESVTSVAFAVGYQSASQFSREYKRLFGQAPRNDMRKLQASLSSEG